MLTSKRTLLKVINLALYCFSIVLLVSGLILSVAPKPVEAAPGSVKSKDSCGASAQDVNSYAVGNTVYVAYLGLGAGTHTWTISYTNKPGKPLVVVAGSSPLIQGTGTVSGDSGCFPAWIVQPEEAGYHFTVDVGGKSDGYNVAAENTPTATATFTPTATMTFTPTAAATFTPTATATQTATATFTPTATATFTPTATATQTATATFTPTATATLTATATFTPTAPAPTATAPAPTATAPAPTATEPAPTATEPAPTATAPAPTATAPAPTVTAPAPTATDPAPTATDPAPTATDPAPTATTPAPNDPLPTETGTPSIPPTDPTLNPTAVPTLSMPAAVDNKMISPVTGADMLNSASGRRNPRSFFMGSFAVFGLALIVTGYRRKTGI